MAPLRLLALSLALTACSVISVDLTPRIRPLEEKTVEGSGDAKILLMELSGFISEDAGGRGLTIGAAQPHVPLLVRVREELTKARGDDRVKALVVRINSAGGTVTASDIIYREIEEFRARTKVPVITIMMDVAASGGYYVALAGDTILAHPTTVTGSIGVIMLTLNAQGLLEKIGVSASAIKSDARKDMGSPFRPLTEEERTIFQHVIDQLHSQFVAKVAERRRLPIERARALSDGRIYTARQALAEGLVDRISYMGEAFEIAKRAAGLDQARLVVYRRPREYRVTYYAQAPGQAATSPADTAVTHVMALLGAGGPRLLYLWWP
jgi:protease IV